MLAYAVYCAVRSVAYWFLMLGFFDEQARALAPSAADRLNVLFAIMPYRTDEYPTFKAEIAESDLLFFGAGLVLIMS